MTPLILRNSTKANALIQACVLLKTLQPKIDVVTVRKSEHGRFSEVAGSSKSEYYVVTDPSILSEGVGPVTFSISGAKL